MTGGRVAETSGSWQFRQHYRDLTRLSAALR